MANDLVLRRALQAVSLATVEVLRTYQLTRTTRKAELIALRDRISEARAEAQLRALGRLTRANIEEIAHTQRMIDNEQLSGAALAYAMDQLRTLHTQLTRNMDGLLHG